MNILMVVDDSKKARAEQSKKVWEKVLDGHVEIVTRNERNISSYNPDLLIIFQGFATPSSKFEESGSHFLRRFWMKQRMEQPMEKRNKPSPATPAIILSFQDSRSLLRYDPRFVLLFAPTCRVVRIPCLSEELKTAVDEVRTRRIDDAKLTSYLHPGQHEVHALQKGLLHSSANILGPLTLLHGAFLEKDLSGEVYHRLYNNITGLIQGLQNEQLLDYFDLCGFQLDPESDHVETDEASPAKGISDILKEAEERKGCELRLLLIDNEAEKGWEDIINELCEQNRVKCISNIKEEDSKLKLADKSPDEISWADYDLVWLDLRLVPSDADVDRKVQQNGAQEAEQFSGIRLLKSIMEKDRSTPVIMLTASKKSYNIALAKKHGSVSFISKEEFLSEEDSKVSKQSLDEKAKAHYRDFRDAIGVSLNFERQNLRRIWKVISGLKQYEDTKLKDHNKEQIIHHLECAFYLASAYLEGYTMAGEQRTPYLPEAIINVNMAGEVIFDVSKTLERFRKEKRPRKLNLMYLAYLRDAFAHAAAVRVVTFYDFLAAFRLFCLALEPDPTFIPVGCQLKEQEWHKKWIKLMIDELNNYLPEDEKSKNDADKIFKCVDVPSSWLRLPLRYMFILKIMTMKLMTMKQSIDQDFSAIVRQRISIDKFESCQDLQRVIDHEKTHEHCVIGFKFTYSNGGYNVDPDYYTLLNSEVSE